MYVTLSFRPNTDVRYGLVKVTDRPSGYWADVDWRSVPQAGDLVRFERAVSLKDIDCYHDGFPEVPGMDKIDLTATYRVEYTRHAIGWSHEHNVVLSKL